MSTQMVYTLITRCQHRYAAIVMRMSFVLTIIYFKVYIFISFPFLFYRPISNLRKNAKL